MEAVSAVSGQPRPAALEQEIYVSVSNATHYRARRDIAAIKTHQFQQDGHDDSITNMKHYTMLILEFIDIRQNPSQ
jgi:hypothetical protein